ncbi:MAG TPA: carboxylesterase family protein [Trebonia sp.]
MAVADPEVRISSGRIRGRAQNGMAVFRGIPFAEPPLGPRRFRAPRPPAPWDGVRDVTSFGPQAPQALPLGTPQHAEPDDGEWLTVNVWTPDLAASGLPVLLWIHGGAYISGSAAAPAYDGEKFARAGTVLVSCNYRLGFEGFALVPGAPANRGLLDQVAALRWVQENIAAFGGDPGNVTVFGESAGAGSVAALLTMGAADGLVRRAIAQSVSGTFFGPDLAAEVTRVIAAEAGVKVDYEELAATDPMHLVNASAEVTARLRELLQLGPVASTFTPYSPVVDGEVLPRSPWRALLSGAARNVELLTGHNRDEYRLFTAMGDRFGKITEADAAAALDTFAPGPDGAAAYRKAYPGASPEQLHELVNSDWLFRMPTLHLAQAHAMSGGTTFLYELRIAAPAGGGVYGACHALDLPLVFGTETQGIGLQFTGGHAPADFVALGEVMRGEWVRFAACGDPGWPSYGTQHRSTRIYDSPPDVAPYPEEASMRIWERHQFDTLRLVS